MPRPKGQRPSVFRTASGKWCARFRINGKLERRYWPAKGDKKLTKTQAQSECDQIAATLNDPGVTNTARMKFSDLCAMWWNLKNPALAPRTRVNYRSRLDASILKKFGEIELAQITPPTVAEWMAEFKGTRKSASLELSIFRSIWNWADVMGYWEGRNPARGVHPGGREVERPGVIPIDTLNLLIGNLQKKYPETALLLRLCASTGCRVGEVLGLRWDRVDLAAGIARIDGQIGQDGRYGQTKTREVREVQLSEHLKQLVLMQPREDEWIMRERKYGTHALRLRTAAKALKIDCRRFGFHTGRRLHATELDKDGLNTRGIMRALGHSSEAMVGVYSRAKASAAETAAVLSVQERIQ